MSFFWELEYALQAPVHTESLQESKAEIIRNSEKLVNQQFTAKYDIDLQNNFNYNSFTISKVTERCLNFHFLNFCS